MLFSVLILERVHEGVTFKQLYSGQKQKMCKGVKLLSVFPSDTIKKHILGQTNNFLHNIFLHKVS